jgi:hypothetical protein
MKPSKRTTDPSAQGRGAGAVSRLDLDGGALDLGRLHLRSDGALPDHVVEAELVGVEELAHRRGGARKVGGADRLVRFLRVLGLGRIVARLLRQIPVAEFVADGRSRCRNRFRRHLHAVGTHVGYEARGLASEIGALVEALGDLHGARGREAEARGGGLLQGRRCEGRSGVPLGRFGFDRQRLERGAFEHGADFGSLRLVGDVELAELPAFEAGQTRLEAFVARRRQVRDDLPVLLAYEALDLGLAVADEPKRHGLHTAGRARARQLAPQHRRKREAYQIVERAARQIGIDQRPVDLARVGHCLHHGLLGDGVEDDAADGLVLDRALCLQHLQHMPGDRLALAVGVGGENEAVGFPDRRGDVTETLRRRPVHRPGHGEVLVGAHRSVLGRQVADMAEGSQDLVVPAEILVDRFRLRRRFDDDYVHSLSRLSGVSGGA